VIRFAILFQAGREKPDKGEAEPEIVIVLL